MQNIDLQWPVQILPEKKWNRCASPTIIKTFAQDIFRCLYSVAPDRNMLHVHVTSLNYHSRPSLRDVYIL